MTVYTRKPDRPIELFRSLLRYEPDTGLFYWIAERPGQRRLGNVAGHKSDLGYVKILIRPTNVSAHRLAWAFMTGKWPTHEIDHINGERHDNRFDNLRQATRAQNCQNKRLRGNGAAGLPGAHVRGNRYTAIIDANGVRHRLGTFSTAEEASAVYLEARRRLHSIPIEGVK